MFHQKVEQPKPKAKLTYKPIPEPIPESIPDLIPESTPQYEPEPPHFNSTVTPKSEPPESKEDSIDLSKEPNPSDTKKEGHKWCSC